MTPAPEGTYITKQLDQLLAFLHAGRVEINTNSVENGIRPLKLIAKKAMLAVQQ